MEKSTRSAKSAVFVGIMGALSNLLSGLSILLVPFLPAIPLGPYSISVALDLSHLTTFIAALYGGPSIAGLTGLIGGMVASYEFGFSQGNLVTGFALPVGKALTGITAGFVMRALGIRTGKRHRVLIVASALLSYIPEGIFTAFLFLGIFPLVFETPLFILYPIAITIVIKGFIEMFAEGIALSALSTNQGFAMFIQDFFTTPKSDSSPTEQHSDNASPESEARDA